MTLASSQPLTTAEHCMVGAWAGLSVTAVQPTAVKRPCSPRCTLQFNMWVLCLVCTAVACWDGSFFRYRFNPQASDGKFCTQESYDVFLDIGDDVL